MKLKTFISFFVLGFLVTSATAQSFLTNGLVAYFPFSGNANDASGNGRNAQIYANSGNVTPTADRFGKPNAAYQFGAKVNDIDPVIWGTGMNLSNSSLTISFWIKASYSQAVDDYGGIGVGTIVPGTPNPGGSTGKNLHIVSNWERIRFSFFFDECDASQRTPTNQWAQLCVVFSTNTANRTVFINGKAVTNRLAAYGFSGNDIFSISGRNGVSMDDVRFFNRALSSDEVGQLYAAESGPQVNLIKAVKPSFSGLWVGTNFQLQVSSNLNNWTNQGF